MGASSSNAAPHLWLALHLHWPTTPTSRADVRGDWWTCSPPPTACNPHSTFWWPVTNRRCLRIQWWKLFWFNCFYCFYIFFCIYLIFGSKKSKCMFFSKTGFLEHSSKTIFKTNPRIKISLPFYISFQLNLTISSSTLSWYHLQRRRGLRWVRTWRREFLSYRWETWCSSIWLLNQTNHPF